MQMFTKQELEALVTSADNGIARLKLLPTTTEMDLQKLEAARGDLIEQLSLAPG
jgi:hypothetical protein